MPKDVALPHKNELSGIGKFLILDENVSYADAHLVYLTLTSKTLRINYQEKDGFHRNVHLVNVILQI